jgi:hypothetical protein
MLLDYTCSWCGSTYSRRNDRPGQFCSRVCKESAEKQANIDSFWLRCSDADENGCREWLGTRNKSGYGKVMINRRDMRTHRVAWELTYGPIPDDMFVCHQCDNPPCCEPTHLFLGTPADNIHDRDQKGRQRRGANVNTAKLTPDDVRKMRRFYETGAFSKAELGRLFGVSKHAAMAVINRRSWKHVA